MEKNNKPCSIADRSSMYLHRQLSCLFDLLESHGTRKYRGVRRRPWGKWAAEIRDPYKFLLQVEEFDLPKYRERAKERREDQTPDYDISELTSFHVVAPLGTVDLGPEDNLRSGAEYSSTPDSSH